MTEPVVVVHTLWTRSRRRGPSAPLLLAILFVFLAPKVAAVLAAVAVAGWGLGRISDRIATAMEARTAHDDELRERADEQVRAYQSGDTRAWLYGEFPPATP